MTIVGTRTELIRLSAVIAACDQAFEHILVHTGQQLEDSLGKIFLRELGLREPTEQLSCAKPIQGKKPHQGEIIGQIISQTYTLMQRYQPDAVLLLGDTDAALSAIAAKQLRIPIFHMDAGTRSVASAMPAEWHRHLVDHLADIHLPATEHARRNLLAEGLPAHQIFITGPPLREVLTKHRQDIQTSQVLSALGLVAGKYFLVSLHREEHIDSLDAFLSLLQTFCAIATRYELPVIYAVHPRSQQYLLEQNLEFPPQLKCYAPFECFDYYHLQQHATCVLSDSDTLAEEARVLAFQAVLLRTATERAEVLEAGSIILGGITTDSICQAIDLAITPSSDQAPLPDDADENVSKKVVQLLQSYAPSLRTSRIWSEPKKPPCFGALL